MTGLDGATIDKDCRDVHARDGDHGSRHIFVTASDGQHAVHALALAYGFDRVGDHLAGNQAVTHACGPHGNSIAHGNRSKYLGHNAALIKPVHSALCKLVESQITWRDSAVSIGYADDGLVKIAVRKTDSTQHGPVGRTFHALGDGPASVGAHTQASLCCWTGCSQSQ